MKTARLQMLVVYNNRQRMHIIRQQQLVALTAGVIMVIVAVII